VVAVGKGVKGIGAHFRKLKASILCEIAGSPAIIEPVPNLPVTSDSPLTATRVPLKLLTQLSQVSGLPSALANDITKLGSV
jgi:hypothetical protein